MCTRRRLGERPPPLRAWRVRHVRCRASVRKRARHRQRARRRRPPAQGASPRARQGAAPGSRRARVLRRRRVRRRAATRAPSARRLLPRARGRARSAGVDGETIRAQPGTAVVVPPGVVHAFTSVGRARFLNVHAPSCAFIGVPAPHRCGRRASTTPGSTRTTSTDARRGGHFVASRRERTCGFPPLLHVEARRADGRQGHLHERRFLRRTGRRGIAVAGGTLWATAPAAARARRYGKAQQPAPARRHLVPGEPVVRPLLRVCAAGAGGGASARRRATRSRAPADVGHAPFELTALRASIRRTGGTPCTTSGTAAAWTASTRARRHSPATATSRCRTTRRASCRTTTACSAARGSARTTSARCSGRRWPNRFYLMSGTSGGITTNGLWGYGDLRLGTVADHPRPARRRRGDVEDLLHRLRRTSRSATRTTSPSSGAAMRTTRGRRRSLDDYLRRLPQRERCRACPGSSRASRCGFDEHPPTRTSRSAWASSSR